MTETQSTAAAFTAADMTVLDTLLLRAHAALQEKERTAPLGMAGVYADGRQKIVLAATAARYAVTS